MPTARGKAVQETDLQTAVDNEISTAWTTIQQMIDWSVSFLPKLAIGLTVFVLFWLIGKGVRAAARRGMGDRPARNVGLVLGRLAQWGLTLLGLLVAVTIMFPSVRPVDLFSLLGISSVAIGFAFKDILQNFLAGILILLRQPFRLGDQIVFKDFEGTVEEIETRTTIIQTYDGRRVYVPNGEIFTNAVIVNTAYGFRRSQCDIGIGYGDDVRRAARAITEALRSIEGVRQDPPPEAIAMAFLYRGDGAPLRHQRLRAATGLQTGLRPGGALDNRRGRGRRMAARAVRRGIGNRSGTALRLPVGRRHPERAQGGTAGGAQEPLPSLPGWRRGLCSASDGRRLIHAGDQSRRRP
jgi:small-conductance mechanosensitive channel